MGKVKETSVVSHTNFVKNPEFEVLTGVEQIHYVSSATRKPRVMVPVTPEAVKKFTPEMKKIVSVRDNVEYFDGKKKSIINGVTFVHINGEKPNLSGKVAYGILPGYDTLKGFYNVKADEITNRRYNTEQALAEYRKDCQVYEEMKASGALTDKEFQDFCAIAKEKMLKRLG